MNRTIAFLPRKFIKTENQLQKLQLQLKITYLNLVLNEK